MQDRRADASAGPRAPVDLRDQTQARTSVVVCTHERPRDLARCLRALRGQTLPPDEVVLLVRDADLETGRLLEEFEPGSLVLRRISAPATGLVAARNAGLEVATGEIIAFLDDDTSPHPHWLERMQFHFLADPAVGGVGGRDWKRAAGWPKEREREVVGKVQWFGRVIGAHHLGTGKPREVDVLKGANMSFRRAAVEGLRFDERLRGIGAQAAEDFAFSSAVKRAGWRLVYDPDVSVDHYVSPRSSKTARPHDDDQQHRSSFDAASLSDFVHNETLFVLEHLTPLSRLAFGLWAPLVGTRDARGLAQWLRFLPSEGRLAGLKLRASLRGRLQGWETWRRRRGA